MLKISTFLIVLLLLLTTVGSFSAAQENELPSLRELADQRGFYIGAAVYTSHLNNPAHVETLQREFNMLTPENEAKACEVQPRLGQFTFQKFDELVAFAEANDMAVHGHTLTWHQCVPDWLATATFTREEAINHLRDHIYTVVGRYKGRVAIWDVVNEGIQDSGNGVRETPWQRLIGDDYIELAFQFAHEADPDALLFYNDYGADGMNNKSDGIYEMAADFVARGIPIHGIGLQGHLIADTISKFSISANIQRFGELGLQVQFTEVDIRHDGAATDEILQQQADDYRNVMEACLENEACTAFITWGVNDGFTWLRDPNLGFFENPVVEPLLFDEAYQPKPAYFAVLDALALSVGAEPILDEQASNEAETAIVVEIPEPSKSDPAQLAPDSVAGAVYYAPFPVTVTLDGDVADWANIPTVTIDDGTMIPVDNDTVMTFAAAADDTNLYFLAEVQDSNIVYGNYEAGEWYREDSVEFYLNTTGDLTLQAYESGIAQLGIMAANLTNPATPLIGGSNSADSQMQVVAVETEGGYRIEASVPLVTDGWTIEPSHEGVLGFQAHLNGSSATDRDTKLIWSVYDIADQSFNNPSLFGQLIFWDVNQ